MAEGAIPVKHKELIALGVGFTTQGPYCIEIHSNHALQAGRQTVVVAAALRAGGAITPGSHATKAHE